VRTIDRRLRAALCGLMLWPAQMRAAEEPLWEAGLGIGALGYNDYRGANSSHAYPVPVPYFLYNGPVLKTDRDGVHAALFHQPWVWQSGDRRIRWDLRLPVRSAFAIEAPPEAIGWTFTPGLAWDFLDPLGHRVGAFMRDDILSGAVFADSPLVAREGYWTAGFGIAWPIGASSQRVETAD
jgi:hypothetical protein